MPVGNGELIGFPVGKVVFRHGRHLGRVRGFEGKAGQKPSHLGGRKHVVHRHVIDSAPGHARVQRGIQALDYRQTALLLDSEQSCGAVIQVSREHDSNHPGAVLVGSGPEKRVDGRAMAVLFGSPGETNPPIVQVKVPIGRGDVDAAGLDRLPVSRVLRRQGACPIEDAR
jgi:hypothetical protein